MLIAVLVISFIVMVAITAPVFKDIISGCKWKQV